MMVLVLFSGFCSQHFALPVPNPLDIPDGIQDDSGTDPHDLPVCSLCPHSGVPLVSRCARANAPFGGPLPDSEIRVLSAPPLARPDEVQNVSCIPSPAGVSGPRPRLPLSLPAHPSPRQTVPTWNNGRSYAKSDFITCLPITWRHRNQIFRSKQAGLQVHEFPFSVFCTCCRIGQESLTGLKLHHVFTRHTEAIEPNFQGQTS